MLKTRKHFSQTISRQRNQYLKDAGSEQALIEAKTPERSYPLVLYRKYILEIIGKQAFLSCNEDVMIFGLE